MDSIEEAKKRADETDPVLIHQKRMEELARRGEELKNEEKNISDEKLFGFIKLILLLPYYFFKTYKFTY